MNRSQDKCIVARDGIWTEINTVPAYKCILVGKTCMRGHENSFIL